ncbi:hypothetical protein JX265_009843 [Neoarthrinium moseri]|uniref:Antifreeze protein n=1 Tax=Neoarthrinium moseri TaxID=1658444 RepID=A0A9P9WFF3_9PEZI|nr:uncharacterized protein JN550_008483 [Neoarthrinium moseri]KAI1860444.1 hypothetical protein JX265_009843 [Neoarthrinium moseri]KAI1864937.1 hypothetical protein JN550_008483 [Neoarthrinium moseri]
MKASVLTSLAILSGGLVEAASHCTSTTTITSTPRVHCDIACIKPTSTCKKGEPTGPPATVTITSGCTVSVIGKGCVGCASCVSPIHTPYPVKTVY